jgi:fungal STAND N-terminal Goodbye domain
MASAAHEDTFDLQDIWKEAQDEFRKTKAGKKLGKRVGLDHVLSIEDVIRGIDDSAREDDEKHATSRKIFSNTMVTVQNLGGLASSGASQVSCCHPNCLDAS